MGIKQFPKLVHENLLIRTCYLILLVLNLVLKLAGSDIFIFRLDVYFLWLLFYKHGGHSDFIATHCFHLCDSFIMPCMGTNQPKVTEP